MRDLTSRLWGIQYIPFHKPSSNIILWVLVRKCSHWLQCIFEFFLRFRRSESENAHKSTAHVLIGFPIFQLWANILVHQPGRISNMIIVGLHFQLIIIINCEIFLGFGALCMKEFYEGIILTNIGTSLSNISAMGCFSQNFAHDLSYQSHCPKWGKTTPLA